MDKEINKEMDLDSPKVVADCLMALASCNELYCNSCILQVKGGRDICDSDEIYEAAARMLDAYHDMLKGV